MNLPKGTKVIVNIPFLYEIGDKATASKGDLLTLKDCEEEVHEEVSMIGGGGFSVEARVQKIEEKPFATISRRSFTEWERTFYASIGEPTAIELVFNGMIYKLFIDNLIARGYRRGEIVVILP